VITVVVADDHPLVRSGLRAVCDAAPDVDVVGEAPDGRSAIEVVAKARPDVVLMDLEMPHLHGVEATRRITTECPGSAVLVLTMFDDDDSVSAAIAAGAIGYLLKGSDGEDILAAVRAAAAGQAVLGPHLAARLDRWFDRPSLDPATVFPELTDRERDILDQVASGRTNPEIADRLHLSAKTVANNVSIILNKLQVTQRGQAIVVAREAGMGRAGD
jgi:DNA-binding NarL/FixJ family response regulator